MSNRYTVKVIFGDIVSTNRMLLVNVGPSVTRISDSLLFVRVTVKIAHVIRLDVSGDGYQHLPIVICLADIKLESINLLQAFAFRRFHLNALVTEVFT